MPDFTVLLPLKKSGEGSLVGIASATSVDRDEERMSEACLDDMIAQFQAYKVPLMENHTHNWENTMGVIKSAQKVGDKAQVFIGLDNANTNPKIAMLLGKLDAGIPIGLSVGGNVVAKHTEYDKSLNKRITVMDKVKLYELSVVGIPSNADSYLSLGQAIAKSARFVKNCWACLAECGNGECKLCLSQN